MLRSPFRSPRRTLLSLALLTLVAACDDQPAAPRDAPAGDDASGEVALQTLVCTADVRANAVSCGPDDEGAGAPPDGLSHIILTPGKFIRVFTSNSSYQNGVLTFDAVVHNRVPQTLGVSTRGQYDGNGVRVFFSQLPTVTEGTGTITVNGAETGKFTRAGQLFYRYPQTLAPGDTSQPRQWSFSVPPTVVRFTYAVQVAASVQHPNGWVEIAGAPLLELPRTATHTLSAVVRDFVGRDVTATSPPILWSVANPFVARVSGTTLTASSSAGTTTITATAGSRAGTLVVRVGTPLVQITAGEEHTCGVDALRRAWCWGLNSEGQLGDSSYTARNVPTMVPGIRAFASIEAGGRHTCALTLARQALCWGNNTSGQLGDGTAVTRRSSPTAVQGPGDLVQLAAGMNHTCARSEEKTYCWGSNIQGQLGDGTLANRNTPVPVQNRRGTYVDLTAGLHHTCALASTGQAYCWGSNEAGQLGDGTTTPRTMPVAVAQGAIRFDQIAAGSFHTCAHSTTGETYCWGANNVGQLGDSTTTQRLTPVAVQFATPFVQITVGANHACARVSTGRTYCWGANESAQLGNGHTANRLTPSEVRRPIMFSQVAAGNRHTCGVAGPRGQVWCWGRNTNGQAGNGGNEQEWERPVAVR